MAVLESEGYVAFQEWASNLSWQARLRVSKHNGIVAAHHPNYGKKAAIHTNPLLTFEVGDRHSKSP
jgi:hypothetical protein